jgi:hypothetical protein
MGKNDPPVVAGGSFFASRIKINPAISGNFLPFFDKNIMVTKGALSNVIITIKETKITTNKTSK